MKFTHRSAGPKKGNGSCLCVRIRKEPKPKKKGDVSTKGRHEGAIATLKDVWHQQAEAI